MTITGKINNIGEIYHLVRSHGDTGGPDARDQKPGPVRPVDRVTLSKEALSHNRRELGRPGLAMEEGELSAEEKQAVTDLKRRDAEVKSHEAAHMAAGGGVVQGGASYEYQSGPDGKMYAVGGEVQIDMSPAGTPQATIRKMQSIRQAALAPAQPSGTDRSVAAQASQTEAQARAEQRETSDENPVGTSTPAIQSDQNSPIPSPIAPGTVGSRIDFRT